MRKKSENLTPLELEIMNVLWRVGSANVQTVQKELERESAYTTVQTILNILEKKGKVRRQLKDRAYIYRPAVTRTKEIGRLFGDMIDRVFAGSAESLVMSLVETKHITPEKLEELNRLLAREAQHDND